MGYQCYITMATVRVLCRPAQVQAVPTSASVTAGFACDPIFQEIQKQLEQSGEEYVKKIKGIFCFKVKNGPGGKEATWVVDVKNGKGSVKMDPKGKGDVNVTIADADLMKLMTGQLNPQQAFFQGKLKIAGNMGLAMKLRELQIQPGKAKL